jgi:hypothetical protein
MDLKRWTCLGISLLLWLAACGTSTATPVRLSPTGTPVFVGDLVSPNGSVYARTTCYRVSVDAACTTRFLNGAYYRARDPMAWSPDGRYAVVCIGANHDSPCSFFDVWDMANGERKARMPAYSPYAWDAGQAHTLVYLVIGDGYSGLDTLTAFDPASEAKTSLAACPDWFAKVFSQACADFPGVMSAPTLLPYPALTHLVTVTPRYP